MSDTPIAAFSAAQLAKRWGCSQGSVYNRIKAGELRFFRFGALIRVPRDEVERIERGECGSHSTEASGPLSVENTDGFGERRFGPVIVPRPNGASVITVGPNRARR